MKKQQTETVLPPAPAPVNERPAGMDFKEYKQLRSDTNKAIRERVKKGFLVFLSNEIILNELGQAIGMKYRSGRTFVGNTKNLQVI